MQARSGFDQMGGKTMAQGVRGADWDIEFFACRGDDLLEGADGHRADRLVHALSNFLRRAGTARGGGKKQ